jgi:hypothetical protein
MSLVNGDVKGISYFTWAKGKGITITKTKTGPKDINVKYNVGAEASDSVDLPTFLRHTALNMMGTHAYGKITSNEEIIKTAFKQTFGIKPREMDALYARFLNLPNAVKDADYPEIALWLNTKSAEFIAAGIAEDFPTKARTNAPAAPATPVTNPVVKPVTRPAAPAPKPVVVELEAEDDVMPETPYDGDEADVEAEPAPAQVPARKTRSFIAEANA